MRLWVPSLIHTQVYSGLQNVYCVWIACPFSPWNFGVPSMTWFLFYSSKHCLPFHEQRRFRHDCVCVCARSPGRGKEIGNAGRSSHSPELPTRLQGRRKLPTVHKVVNLLTSLTIARRQPTRKENQRHAANLQGVQPGSMNLRKGQEQLSGMMIGIFEPTSNQS